MTDERPQGASTTKAGRSRSPRDMAVAAGLVILAFLVGFVWQWTEARGARAERDELRTELELQEMENLVASAVIQVDNESYEVARGMMSDFFTRLQQRVEAASDGARSELQDILSRRDAVITALSRADPASEELLQRIYTRYKVAMGGPDAGIPIPASRPGDSGPAGDTGGAGTGPAGGAAGPRGG